jgi:predicted DNA repair protein MutK
LAFPSLLALLDDIASLLDDVATMTKVATKKTAGVLGDDLALNAEQVAGVKPDRELPVVLAVAKGSAINKVILVPVALLISGVASWLITPLLMVGGAFLCFEGFEKVAHKLFHRDEEKSKQAERVKVVANPEVDLVAFEKSKIRGAIRTDFILSAEIIVITLGSVGDAAFSRQVATLSVVAVLMTIGVYGLVAGIVKLDDLGLALSARSSAVARGIGSAIVRSAPWLMKGLGVAGTIAMFLVGGGILTHGFHGLEVWIAKLAEGTGPIGEALIPTLGNAVVGVLAGALLVGLLTVARKVLPKREPKPE